MTRMFNEKEIDGKALQGKKIAVLGYGSQGRGQALNVRDSGFDVVLGLRPGGKTWKQAEDDGWHPMEPGDAVKSADVICMLVPDMAQRPLFEESVAPNIKKGAMLLFAHGFNIHYGQIKPPPDCDVAMIAPKGPGKLVRDEYQIGRGVPCLVAVANDATGKALERALAYGFAVGGARAGILETTFAEETETDLFGEQAVLCGGATELVVAGYETLVAAGYQPEVAYFECLHELKLIVDLLYQGGITRMLEFVSDTAKFGDLTRGPRIVDQKVRDAMKQVLSEVRDGTFANEWIKENEAGLPRYRSLLQKDLDHPIETVGRQLRSRMAWLNQETKK